MPSVPPPKPIRPAATDRSVPAICAEAASSVVRVASISKAASPLTMAPAPMETSPPREVSTPWRMTLTASPVATRTSAPQSLAAETSTSSTASLASITPSKLSSSCPSGST
ncbi:hypothetical protein D3C87_948430 [compost metagenome]